MFISSSNDRLPPLSFGKIWLLVGLSLVLFFIGWDWFWLSRRVVPLPNDDAKLWAYHRRRVSREGNQSVVLIGSSRMQTDLDQNKFTQLTGKKTIQLAIVGQSPLPLLQNLAEDESFKGTVISDFSEFLVYQDEVIPNLNQTAEMWVKDYKESKAGDDFEFWLRGYGRYLVANPHLGNNPPDALKNIINGDVFEKTSIGKMTNDVHPTFFDRSLIFNTANFLTKEEHEDIIEKNRKAPVDSMRYLIENSPPQPARFLEIVNKIESSVKKIQSRGGKVIIVNFPMSGELADLNDIAFPREKFWDVLVEYTSAKTIHYRDYPGLSKFICPDGSHLEAKDTPEFTENLVKTIYENN